VSGWTTLSRRNAGLPPETELVEGISGHLVIPVKRWIDGRLVEGDDSYWDRAQLETGSSRYGSYSGDRLLDLVDWILFWYPRMPPGSVTRPIQPWPMRLAELEQILSLGRSAWRVNAGGDGLERRLEPAVTSAARHVIAAAPPATQDHLQAAWAAAFGRHLDADKVFSEAIRAVEDIACPLVEQKKAASGTATLGTALGELRNSFAKWELVLPGQDGQPRDISHLIGMMELLWHSQISRHGGAPKSRRQSPGEAQAAVHLAVILVQWLSTGVLRRKAGR
jgi:hypothetical protein